MSTIFIGHDMDSSPAFRIVPAVPINSVAGATASPKKPVRNFSAFIILCSLATAVGITPAAATTSSIASNFNGTPILVNNWLWFNSHFSDLPANPGHSFHIYVVNTSVTIEDGADSHVINIPDATLTFTPGAPDPIFGSATAGEWATTYNGDRAYLDVLTSGNHPFIAGVGYQWDQAFDPNNADVTWRADFLTDSPLVAAQSIRWRWSAAVYTSFSGDISAVNSTALDGNAGFTQSGSPAAFSTFLINGARGGGGGNYTGAGTAPDAVVPGLIPEPGTASVTALALLGFAFRRGQRARRG